MSRQKAFQGRERPPWDGQAQHGRICKRHFRADDKEPLHRGQRHAHGKHGVENAERRDAEKAAQARYEQQKAQKEIRRQQEEEQRFEVVENGGEPVKTIDKTEAARPAGVDDLEELSGETKAAAPADSPITKSADAISVVPPASPGPSTDHNPAYNSGKGVSMVPPPQEVTDAQAADAAAAAGEGDQGDGDETVADKTETAEPLPEGWERFNKDDLVALCTEREIDPEGNKADLKERLQSWQDEHPPKDE